MDQLDVNSVSFCDTWDTAVALIKGLTDRQGELALIYFARSMDADTTHSKNDPNRALYLMRRSLKYVLAPCDLEGF